MEAIAELSSASSLARLAGTRRDVASTVALLVTLRLRIPRELGSKSLPDLLRSLTRRAPLPPPAPIDLVETRRAIAISEGVCRRLRIVRDTCLYRSIARYAAWQRLGVPARFVMAIRRDSAREMEGHAWVEVDGVPEDGESTTDYVVTFSYP